MDLRKLQRVAVDALEDIKAQDIKVFNTAGMTNLFDRVVIASGTSNRQTRALASHLREKVKAAGGEVISTEGEETGEWVLVDLGDIVVHLMQPAIRAYYELEEIWGGKPVRVKLGESPTGGLAKTSGESAPALAAASAKAATSDKAATSGKAGVSGKGAAARKPSAPGKPTRSLRARPTAGGAARARTRAARSPSSA